MQVLVTAASRHGATAEIAQAIARGLAAGGVDAVVLEPAAVDTLDGFDAVVLGSAVYAGHWLGEATELVDRLRDAWAARAVWLFSSGPVGDPPKPAEDAVDIAAHVARTGARGHRLFAGRIDRSRLGFAEKALVIALRVPDGDWRDWDVIDAWAAEIAAALRAPARAT